MILYKKTGKRYTEVPTAELVVHVLDRLSLYGRLKDHVRAIQTSFMFGEIHIDKREGTSEDPAQNSGGSAKL